MPADSTALQIVEITEFSLVPNTLGSPANEHATIDLTKAQEGGAQVPNDSIPTDIQKALEEIALLKAQNAEVAKKAEAEALINKANAEKIAGMEEAAAFAKCESRLDSQGISKALAADFRAFEKAAPESCARIEAALAKATRAAANVDALTKSIGEFTHEEGSPAAKLAKSIETLRKADTKLSENAAYNMAFDGLSKSDQLALIGGK